MMLRNLVLAICGLSLFSVEASARHILWTLRDVQFNDGGTAMGSFVYNVDTNKYSAVSIVTTAGHTLPGETYNTASASALSNRLAGLFLTRQAEDQARLPGLYLIYARALTNDGGDVGLDSDHSLGLEMTCLNAACTSFGSPARFVVAGFLEGTPVEGSAATSGLGGGLPSTENTLAAALLGGLWTQARFPLSQRPAPAPIPSGRPLEAYLRPARCRVVGI